MKIQTVLRRLFPWLQLSSFLNLQFDFCWLNFSWMWNRCLRLFCFFCFCFVCAVTRGLSHFDVLPVMLGCPIVRVTKFKNAPDEDLIMNYPTHFVLFFRSCIDFLAFLICLNDQWRTDCWQKQYLSGFSAVDSCIFGRTLFYSTLIRCNEPF